ncbi:MAG TPA: xylose isomerase, partial [Blastocatellia bacterium]|nr:xylose isomerase [Blastocatellia bacterium]
EDQDGVWDFAAGCMRTYLIFKEKAKQFAADKEIQALLQEIKSVDPSFEPIPVKFSKETAEKIKNLPLDRIELAKKKLPYEKLDQLVIDLLLGVR